MNTTPSSSRIPAATAASIITAQFGLGHVVRHRLLNFRGVIFDIDPVFANSEEWYQSIPADMRPRKDQPFYHLFAENDESTYVAYVSQQNLISDADAGPVSHPAIDDVFDAYSDGQYRLRTRLRH
jgi:heat shock protein HspQ